MPNESAYLDHNATSPLRPEARAAIESALDTVGNPSSVHGAGRAARRLAEEARVRVAALAGATPAEVIFTAGGTEANAMALRGIARVALVSAVEHPSVLENAPDAAVVPVDTRGCVDLDALDDALAGGPPALVSVMAANNETGVVMPIEDVSEIAHRHGALLHVDAVQLAGKGDLAAVWSCADLLTPVRAQDRRTGRGGRSLDPARTGAVAPGRRRRAGAPSARRDGESLRYCRLRSGRCVGGLAAGSAENCAIARSTRGGREAGECRRHHCGRRCGPASQYLLYRASGHGGRDAGDGARSRRRRRQRRVGLLVGQGATLPTCWPPWGWTTRPRRRPFASVWDGIPVGKT